MQGPTSEFVYKLLKCDDSKKLAELSRSAFYCAVRGGTNFGD